MIKVGLVGAGAIANTHIEGFLKFQDRARIVAVADIYLEKAQQKIETYGLAAVAYDDYKNMFSNEELDLVVIVTPPFAHTDPTIAALKTGANVLLEKPMAPSLKECDEMLAAEAESGKFISVVAQNRFMNPMMKLREVVKSGLAGNILHAQVDLYWWRGQSYYDLWWRGTWEKEGGGCTLNHAVHHIDLFQWMMGMPIEVQSVVTNINHENSEVEDFSTSILRYEDGRIGQITASLIHHGENQRLIFQGESASISAPWQVQASLSQENGFPMENEELEKEIQAHFLALPDLAYEGHAGQIQNVLACLEGKEELMISGEEGRRTLELVSAIYQSGVTGKAVKLPMSSDAPFYTREGVLSNVPHFHEKTRSIESASEDITFGSTYKKEG